MRYTKRRLFILARRRKATRRPTSRSPAMANYPHPDRVGIGSRELATLLARKISALPSRLAGFRGVGSRSDAKAILVPVALIEGGKQPLKQFFPAVLVTA